MRAIQTVMLEGNPKGTVQRNAKTQHFSLSLSEGTSASEAANLNLTFFSTSTDAVWAWCPGHH